MKVVINNCFGGFGLSPEALLRLYKMGNKEIATPVDEYYPPEKREERNQKYPTISYEAQIKNWREYIAQPDHSRHASLFLTVFTPDEKFVLNGGRELKRDDPMLIKLIEEMGEKANGQCANLKIVEIPDDADYEIAEYDGNEHIAEKHRTWS